MMSGFIGGAATGGVFRAIGNYVQVGKLPGQPFGKGGETADKILRGVSSSLFDGLQATAAGATTPEQIYSYLLGAYFGVTEMPYHRRLGAKFLQKTRTSKYRNDELETVPGWEKLDERTRTYVIKKDAEIPKGKFMTAEVVKQLREEGLIKQDSQQSIEQQRQEFIKQEQRIAEDERKISIKDIVETEKVLGELTESFYQAAQSSKKWTIVSRFLSGTGLWAIQNKLRGLISVFVEYQKSQMKTIENQQKVM